MSSDSGLFRDLMQIAGGNANVAAARVKRFETFAHQGSTTAKEAAADTAVQAGSNGGGQQPIAPAHKKAGA